MLSEAVTGKQGRWDVRNGLTKSEGGKQDNDLHFSFGQSQYMVRTPLFLASCLIDPAVLNSSIFRVFP